MRRTLFVAVVATAAVVVLAAAQVAGAGRCRATAAELDAYRQLRGELASADTTYVGDRGRYRAYTIRIASTTGLVATGRLLRPADSAAALPGVLLNDGRELNSEVLRYLPPDFGDVVVLALDYPEELPYEIDLKTMLFRSGRLVAAARRIPAIFSLGAAYLVRRDDVDSARVAVAATSFAVPFATIAAAIDQRFRNVALVYGAGNFAEVLAANLSLRPRPLRELAAWLVTRPLVEFEPARFVDRIAPRPLIMVNGVDDPQMPARAVRSLYDAAREPKTLLWLRTGHLMPTDTVLIRALVDTALHRMPVLRRGG